MLALGGFFDIDFLDAVVYNFVQRFGLKIIRLPANGSCRRWLDRIRARQDHVYFDPSQDLAYSFQRDRGTILASFG